MPIFWGFYNFKQPWALMVSGFTNFLLRALKYAATAIIAALSAVNCFSGSKIFGISLERASRKWSFAATPPPSATVFGLNFSTAISVFFTKTSTAACSKGAAILAALGSFKELGRSKRG